MKLARKVSNLLGVAAIVSLVGVGTVTMAAPNSQLQQQIKPGTLSTDVLDASRNPVASPSAALSALNFSFNCQTSTGTLGTNTERLYVSNGGAADGGWNLTMAATGGPATKWVNGANSFSFNNSAAAGCTAGQLTVNPALATVTADHIGGTDTGITKGSSASYVSGTADSVTLMSAGLTASKAWRGYLTGIGLSQAIPAEQTIDTYTINMTLTATAL